METFEVLKITWKELEDMGYASVTDYCRFLMDEQFKLPDRIEIYRGEMLCMTVTDVAEAAKLQPSCRGFVKYNPPPQVRRRIKAPAFVAGEFK